MIKKFLQSNKIAYGLCLLNCFIVLCFIFIIVKNFRRIPVGFVAPSITSQQVYQSAAFLANCSYLRNTYPQQYHKLTSGQVIFKIIQPNFEQKGICGEFVPNLMGQSSIIMFSNSFYSVGCKGPNPMHVLSHEMLHQIGLPEHKSYATYEEYVLRDPIERVMQICTDETIRAGRSIKWN